MDSSHSFLSVLKSHTFLGMQLARAELINGVNRPRLWSVSEGDKARSLYKGARSILIKQDNKNPFSKSSKKFLHSSSRINLGH